MLAELRRCGIYDDVAQWHSLDTFLHSLTMFSTCWQYCFPGLPPPSIPIDEYESVAHLPWLGLILEVLVVVRIALQIPIHAMSQSYHTVANRYELHRCRRTAYLLISFLQRLISQDYGYVPPFFEVLHFYKTSLLCEIMHSTFADTRHLRSLRTRFPDLYDFIHDPGHHQQPCVYIRLSPWHTPYYVGATDQDVLRREHSRSRKFLQLLRGRHAFFEPALHYWKRSNTYWLFCAIPVEIKLPISSVWVQKSKWQYLLRPHLNAPWVHRLLRKVGFREHLVDFRRHSLSSPTSLVYTNVFDDDYIRIFNGNYDLKCWMTFKRITPLSISWDPTQAHRSRPCETYCRRLFLPLSSTTSCDSPSSSTSPFVQKHRNSSPR